MNPLIGIAGIMMSVAVIGGGVSGHLLGKHYEEGLCKVVLGGSLILGWAAVFLASAA